MKKKKYSVQKVCEENELFFVALLLLTNTYLLIIPQFIRI